MERKIGEIFEYNGEWYQCIPDTTDDNCNNCFFQKCCSDITGYCSSTARSDGKSVAFKKLEKVGEPYIIGNKLIQRYKIYPTTYHINVYGWYYHNLDVKSWTIDIEIKQNKEDMEKKKQKLDDLVGLYTSAKITYKEFNEKLKTLYADKEECKSSLKEFDLEAAKSGKPVCTRDGRKARIICFDLKNEEYPIVAAIGNDSSETLLCYTLNGEIVEGNYKSDKDLMMLPEKKEGCVNVYSNSLGGPYESKEYALKQKMKDCIDTVKISWGGNDMAWVAVDKDGRECIYQFRPKRGNNEFRPLYGYSMWMALPKGSIKKLIGRDITWQDEPVELKEE